MLFEVRLLITDPKPEPGVCVKKFICLLPCLL